MTQHGATCGCCVGLEARTPAEVVNAPGLSAIVYRVGTWASFRETMLSHFATTRTKSGDALDARSQQNFAAALADAWAVVGDILTFYQERIANESYLRTATERASVLELARMIGYELKPGVAAETWLAFTIDDPPALPATPKTSVASLPLPVRRDAILDAGLKVQSVPGPNEKPQTFETMERIVGWPEWNAVPLRVRRPQHLGVSTHTAYLDGEVEVKTGEFLLLQIGTSAELRRVASRTYDPLSKTTAIEFVSPGPPPPPGSNVTPYEDPAQSTLRQTKVKLTSAVVLNEILTKNNGTQLRAWRAEDLATIAGFQGWELDELERMLYRWAQRDRNVAAGRKLSRFKTRAAVFGHNAVDPAKLPTGTGMPTIPNVDLLTLKDEATVSTGGVPVFQKFVNLDTVYPDITKNSWCALQWTADDISLKRIEHVATLGMAKYMISARFTRIFLNDNTDFKDMPVRHTSVHAVPDAFTIGTEPIADPTVPVPGTQIARKGVVLDGVHLRLVPGRRVVITGKRADLEGQTGHEQRTIEEVRIEDGLTTIYFDTPLSFTYDWTTVTINANVARATHGESTKETLGSGNAAAPYQNFALRQKPLTYTGSSASPTGTESSLRVFVNDVEWHEEPMLYGTEPTERIFATHRADDGTVNVQFGDGLTGARVPTGIENVRAEYRKGIGLEGLVRADQLSILLSRPLGAKGVTNPLPAFDAADPEPRDEARRNAPLQVLTLGRAVSLRDFEDFARGFAGVAKSLATRINAREKPGVFVTVAAANGAEFTRVADLHDALRKFGDPFVPIVVRTFHSVVFRVNATVKIDKDRVPEVMRKTIEETLRAHYSFDARSFGQPVFRSEVIAVLQSVEGVVSANVTIIDPDNVPNSAIAASVPYGDITENTLGADLLTLDPRPMALTVVTS